MPSLLTTNAIITCPHGGAGTTVPLDPILSVNGGTACAENDTGTLACPFVVPCVGYTLQSMNLNATTIAGRKAILSTDFQQTVTGLPLTISDPNFCIDDSTPASLPPGETSQPIPPEMQDTSAPTVVAAPPTGAFNSVTMMPATLPIVFTLSHPFPMQWTLTLINGVALTNMDVTNGVPPGLVVAPAGGSWNSPSLPVTATLTAAFLAALGPGMHYLYMTAISQRGISAYAEVPITVS